MKKAMRRTILILFLTTLALLSQAQNMEDIMRFTGCASEEDLNQYDVENLEDLLLHPLRINQSSISRLEESGLFTQYQAVSLADYRSRHGDILSFNELSLVDGFNEDLVKKLSPFISLESHRLAGQSGDGHLKNDFTLRLGSKKGKMATYGIKYRLESERITGGLAISRTSSSDSYAPDAYSGHLTYHFKRQAKLIIGDFNARFGQGLALWNGMSIGGLSSASGFMKRPSALSASSSFTGGYALRGLAFDMTFGKSKLSALLATKKKKEAFILTPAVNISRYLSIGQLSMTHYMDLDLGQDETRIPDMKTAADMAFCFSGTDLFAELSFDWVSQTVAALSGVSVPLTEEIRMASMLRYYPSSYTASRSAAARSTTKCTNEYAFSLASDISAGEYITINAASGFGSSIRKYLGKVSGDFAYFPEGKDSKSELKSFQIKAQTEWSMMLSGKFKLNLKFSERFRTWGEKSRTDIRADILYYSRFFTGTVRINALHSKNLGLLGYVEGAYKTKNLTIYLRQGVFRIDNWQDRIYAYERDAPGAFNIPAYYGRGVWTATTANWKFSRWGKLYFRAAFTSYPFMEEEKPGSAELKFQLLISI